MWEKEKLLFESNFSFSHSVFKIPVLQNRKNQGLFWKGLITLLWNSFSMARSDLPIILAHSLLFIILHNGREHTGRWKIKYIIRDNSL